MNKNGFSVQVRDVSYAKYGVVEGVRKGGSARTGKTCMIVSKGWPSWAFGASGVGMHVSYVMLLSSDWEDTIVRLFPDAIVMNWSGDGRDGSMRKVEVDEVDFCFTDVDPPGRLDVWSMVRRSVVSSRRCRRQPRGWKEEVNIVKHSECGGVTDYAAKLHIYSREPGESQIFSSTMGRAGRRDLSAILNSRSRIGMPCQPPAEISLKELAVWEVSGSRGTYHGGGWIPWGIRNLRVLTPNDFSTTKWCKRKISDDEWMQVFDIPVGVVKSLTAEERSKLVADSTVMPVKTLTGVCQSLIEHQWPGEKERPPPEIHRAARESEVNVPGPEGAERRQYQEEDRMAKATKSDDAAIPEYLWDDRLLELLGMEMSETIREALTVLRGAFARRWKRNVTTSFIRWWMPRREEFKGRVDAHRLVVFDPERRRFTWRAKGRKQYKVERNARRARDRGIAEDAVDAIRRSANSTWWEWTEGSFPFFWRWPEWYQEAIRLGVAPWFVGVVPKCAIPQRPETDAKMRDAMKGKLVGPMLKGYLERGMVFSLTSFFAVPKGLDDIRMVYDGTKSGLNAAMFAPWFPLPTVDQLIRVVNENSYMGDIDVGEMFLNFVMHKDLRVYCGVDLSAYFPELASVDKGTVWYRWSRCGMGFKNSPYVSTQGMAVGEEVMMGDPHDPRNVFRWDEVILNLPGMEAYEPCRPWVAKMRASDSQIACDGFIYVDDVRSVGPTEAECWQASRTLASKMNWLGLQDAARKRRPPSKTPGAWAGSIVQSNNGEVIVMVSEERWQKTKRILQWMMEEMNGDGTLEFKTLESYRGFLVYVARTYPSASPYLKGIHQTLDSWRPWRRDDGWRMTLAEMRVAMEEKESGPLMILDWDRMDKPPERVAAAPRLKWDLEALCNLFEGDVPVRRKVRPRRTAVAIYGFGDASGKGFGSSFVIGDELIFRHGQWATSVEVESSNYRELSNLVLAVEEAARNGHLADCELFLFTDNTTAEGCYYRGTSNSRKLFELVLRLRKLQVEGDIFIHVIHIAGTRMIEEGTDGLSRGNINEGVMTGANILSYIPLHLSGRDRQQELLSWILSVLDDENSDESYKCLTETEWYTTGQTRNKCLWMPPPAAADVAVELLGKSKHKRPQHEHVLVAPRLMTNRWRKQLTKICDVVITIPVGTQFWGVHQHEPLLVGFALPLISHRPWRLRGVPLLERAVSQLSSLPPTAVDWGRDILQQLLGVTRELESLPEGVVWEMLHPPG